MREKPQTKQDQIRTHSASENKHYEEIVNRSPAVAFVWKAMKGWPVDFVSDNVRQFGYKPQDFYSGKVPYASIIYPEDLERVSFEVNQYTLKGIKTFTQEYRIITHDKQVRWVDDRTWIQRDEQGRAVTYQGIILDITDRKKIEEELRDREGQIRLITDNMVDVISQTDAKLNIIYCSPSLVRVFGYRPEDIIGQSVTAWIHPDDLKPNIEKAALARKAGLPSVTLEYRWRHATGDYLWIESATRLLYDDKHRSAGAIFASRVIDERKHTAEALKVNEERLRLITDNMADVVARLDADMNFIYISPSAATRYGFAVNELLGKSALQWLYPDDVEIMVKESQRARKEHSTGISIEHRQLSPDGSYRWVESKIQLLYDSRGDSAGSIINIRDIDDRKKAEEALTESEEKFRSIVENSLAGIFKVDDSFHFVYANAECCQILGYPIDKLIGMNFQEALSEESRALVADRYVRRQRGEILPPRYEIKVKRGDGELRDVEMIVSVVKDSAGIPSTMGQIVDITERKQSEGVLRESEEKFRSIVENSLAGIFKVDDSFHFVYANAECCQILGYPIDKLIGMNFQEALSEESRALVADRYVRRQRGEILPPRYEIKVKRGDGELRDVEMIVSVVKDSAGIPSTMGQIVDISERKQNENVIKANERLLSAALRVAKMGYWEFDVNSGMFIFNDQYYALHKTTSEAAGGYRMTAEDFARNYVYSEDANTVQERIMEGLATTDANYQSQTEGRIVCSDGEVRWIIIWFRVEKDKDGRTIKLLGVNQDIHDRKLAEEKVLQHAAHVEALARTATQINRKLDLDTILNSVCEEAARTLKIPYSMILMADASSQTVTTFNSYGLPDDYRKEVANIPFSIYRDNLEKNEGTTQVIHVLKEGTVIPISHLVKKYGISTITTAKIKWQSQLIGVLAVICTGEERAFNEDELLLLQSLADVSAQAIMNARFLEDASRRLKRLETLRTIDNAITSSLDLRHTLSMFLDQLRNQLNVDAADILLFNPHSLTYDYAFGIGMHTDTLKNASVYPDNDPVGTIVLKRQRVQIPELQYDADYARNHAFMREGFMSYFGIPLISKGQVRGVLEIFHRTHVDFDQEWIDFLEALAGQAAISIDNAALFDELQRSNLELTLAYDATIEGWSHALDLRDEGTEGHTQRVTHLTLKLARELGIQDEELNYLRRGAILHDIGKMGISDEILLKPGKLKSEEMAVMKKHPEYANQMLSTIRYLKPSLDIPYYHHEKWDGSGYPRGFMGEQIPLAARLFAIVDVWDALTNNRPYRDAWSKPKALEYIKEQSGKHFDPAIVKSFLKIIKSELSE